MSCYVNYYICAKPLELKNDNSESDWEIIQTNAVNIASFSRNNMVGGVLMSMYAYDTIIVETSKHLKECVEELLDEKIKREKAILSFYETVAHGKLDIDDAIERTEFVGEYKEDIEYLANGIFLLRNLIDCIEYNNAVVYVLEG